MSLDMTIQFEKDTELEGVLLHEKIL